MKFWSSLKMWSVIYACTELFHVKSLFRFKKVFETITASELSSKGGFFPFDGLLAYCPAKIIIVSIILLKKRICIIVNIHTYMCVHLFVDLEVLQKNYLLLLIVSGICTAFATPCIRLLYTLYMYMIYRRQQFDYVSVGLLLHEDFKELIEYTNGFLIS